MKKQISFEEVLQYVKKLPYSKFREVIDEYSKKTGQDFSSEINALTVSSLEKHLEQLGVNSACPKCGETDGIPKYGHRNHVQVFKCKKCGHKFSRFSGTVLEKSRWHWDIWIRMLQMTINNQSIDNIVHVLQHDYGCEGINHKTVWMWRMKLIHALASLPMPKLTGIVQVDETFIRESQKGSKKLYSTLGSDVKREPRYGRRPSLLGSMGPEFATVVTAIDNRGYCVCKVSGLGRMTTEMFVDLFDEHFEEPACICSDANSVYDAYCELRNIPHYEKPSNYLTVLTNNGYVTPDRTNPATAAATRANNEKILERLYEQELIDRITNRGPLSYEEFEEIKKTKGLSLARVNELHSEIKKYLYTQMTNVSSKYLQDYIGFFTYIHNWKVSHGHQPASLKDAEEIFTEILHARVNYTVKAIKATVFSLPKPTGRYIHLLKNATEKAREAVKNIYFKFNSEDGVREFNKREYLLDQPKAKLYRIAKECGFTKYKKLALPAGSVTQY